MDAHLKMDRPVEKSWLDSTDQGIISTPVDRVEGPLKTTGRAKYAAEFEVENLAHGVLVGAAIGKGRVSAIDARAVEAMPGVLAVVTDYSRFLRYPAQGLAKKAPPRSEGEISYFGQPIALVVAETFEAARHGALALDVRYERAEGRFDFAARRDTARKTNNVLEQGDLAAAMAAGHATIDAIWTTPSQNAAAMEPHASVAVWSGDTVTLYGSYQMLSTNKLQAADALDLEVKDVRMLAHYVGGGFGGKLGISEECVAAALAAREIGRPVKVVMARQQVFDSTVRRSNTEQRLRLSADKDGKLTGIGHDTVSSNLDGDDFAEPAGMATHFMYGGENRTITHALVRVDQMLAGSMRAPGEAVGMLALEGAMDELAETLGLDPIDLRKRNIPDDHPEKNIPYSSRALAECMDAGADAFGWRHRNPKPAMRREGEWWLGMGMAASGRSNLLLKSSARVTLTPEGRAVVETDMTDIGTGTYTILAQITAEMLGLPVRNVDVRLGDTDFPPASGSGGSFGAASAGSSVYLACEKMRETLADALGGDMETLVLSDGMARMGNISKPLSEVLDGPVIVTGTIEPGETSKAFAQAGFGAHFAEVAVNAYTGEVRVRRMESTFAAGRILNEKTARSQCLGGMVFGIGTALTEELMHDRRLGVIANHDLAEYHLPVNADVPQLKVTFLEERDTAGNPLLAKGLGELGISGAGASIANAVYNACGVRVRDYPVTLDKLIDHLPPLS